MNFTFNVMLWVMSTLEKADDSAMVNLIIKWMGILFILSGVFAGIDTEGALYNLGCMASILFGFLLQTSHLRRRKVLTGKMLVWNAVTTGSVTWFAFTVWYAKLDKQYAEWIMVYLFVCSFMAVVISEILHSVSKVGFREAFKMVVRKLLSDSDKEENI